MIEVINLEKISDDGFKQPANNPNSATPDIVTHAQLRYNTFSSSYVVQGSAIYNSSSTFEFDVSDVILNLYGLFKLYVSTDGTTYTERKSYGGTNGTTLTNVTGSRMGLQYSCRINQSSTNAPVASNIVNTTGTTATWSYVGVGIYKLTFGSNELFNETIYKHTIASQPFMWDAQLGTIEAIALIDYSTIAGAELNLYSFAFTEAYGSGVSGGATYGSQVVVMPLTLTSANGIMTNYYLKINFYPL